MKPFTSSCSFLLKGTIKMTWILENGHQTNHKSCHWNVENIWELKILIIIPVRNWGAECLWLCVRHIHKQKPSHQSKPKHFIIKHTLTLHLQKQNYVFLIINSPRSTGNFYTAWGFLTFSGCIERDYWNEIS